MLLSMTGFGKGECAFGNGGMLAVQISSVNRKQFELRCSLPSDLAFAEVNARKTVSSAVSRGAVQLRCTYSVLPEKGGKCTLNRALLDELIRECCAARVRGNLSGDVAVEKLVAIPGVLTVSAAESDEEELAAAFENALDTALANYNAMRRHEGEILAQDLLQRLEKLEKIHSELAEMSAAYPESAKKRLLERIEAEKLTVSVDDPALLKELLFYVDRGDVTEELTRLNSHFQQFRKLFLCFRRPVKEYLS